jgi:hypothetical protein
MGVYSQINGVTHIREEENGSAHYTRALYANEPLFRVYTSLHAQAHIAYALQTQFEHV